MSDIKITFWGVRGSIAVPGKETFRYGGNTSCVEAQCGNKQVIFDAGTGLYGLGKQSVFSETDILLSHSHLDHIQGFPFFAPLLKHHSRIRVWAGHLMPEGDIESVINTLMHPPIFPLTLQDMKSTPEFHNFKAGAKLSHPTFQTAGITVSTLLLNHPDRSTGYRLEYQGKSVCYITDMEHLDETPEPALVEFVKDAGLLIYDSTYDDSEMKRHKGWGHSTWQQAVRLADKAGVKTLALFHHNPLLSDEAMDARAVKLEAARPGSLIAKEGLVVTI